MCNPMAFIMAAQSAAQISAENQAAESEQKAAVERQAIMNQQRVMEMEETNRKAALELTENKREALRQQATLRTSAAESGVAGASPLRNLMDVYVQESIKSGSVISKGEAQLAQIGVAAQGDFIQARNRIDAAESRKTTGLGAALQIGLSAAQGYSMGGGEFAFSTDTSIAANKAAGTYGTGFGEQWRKTTDSFSFK